VDLHPPAPEAGGLKPSPAAERATSSAASLPTCSTSSHSRRG
jgi:hypothetical protein